MGKSPPVDPAGMNETIQKGGCPMDINCKEAAAFLKASDDILILCHRNPDGDTLGSGCGLCRALRCMGKCARILVSDPIPRKMQYLAEGCSGDFEPQTIVSTDIADEQLFGDALEPYRGRVQLAIDHHPSNSRFAERLLLDPGAAATTELVFAVIRELGVPLTCEIADCLYTGLATDTGCFAYSNTTPQTHRIAADLIEAGCRYKELNKLLFETKSLSVMAAEREALNSLEMHFNGRAALILISRDMLTRTGVTESELDGIAAIPRKIEGVEIGITVKERGDREYKISIRTGEQIDACRLCQNFGGGGHARAAGCTIEGSLDEVKALILGAAGRTLEENP